MASPPDYRDPPLLCDIVMKGGITSGVVYPGAVMSLARRYRFKCIGGTSAGGIAAAVVAAAEYAPDRNASFAAVGRLPDELSSAVDGKPFMLQLFQPEPENRRLFGALIRFLERGPLRGAAGLAISFPRAPLLALVLATAAVVLGVAAGLHAGFVAAAIVLALVLLVAGAGHDLVRAVLSLPRTDFGLCRLGRDAPAALTPWLHARIQAVADLPLERPLRFADLWGVAPLPAGATDAQRAERRARIRALSIAPRERDVDLQMMTTNLTHGRPMRLPVPYQPIEDRLEEGGGLLYDPEELKRFFPAPVMAALEEAGDPLSEETVAELAGAGWNGRLRRFPIGPDLPVVVATRMTLSFPILIAAIPLWELQYRAGGRPPLLRRVVFSDGGITSNFPVHFFDSPLPTRPTFALGLTSFPEGEGPVEGDPSASVIDPPAANAASERTTADIASLGQFLVALKDAVQNWRDNAQAELPGFRERVIQIKLAGGEGGMNLTMDDQKIIDLNRRGAYAGERLAELFSGPADAEPRFTVHWNDSRFARYRVAMAMSERWLRNVTFGFREPPDRVSVPYDERIAAGDAAPYAFPSAQVQELSLATTRAYGEQLDRQGTDTLDGEGVPRPPATLRSMPPV